MKKKTKKILKWILIIGGIVLSVYLIGHFGESNLLSVTIDSVPSTPSEAIGGIKHYVT